MSYARGSSRRSSAAATRAVRRGMTGVFTITGFRETAAGKLEAVRVAEERVGKLVPAGEVQFSVGKGLWTALDVLRRGEARRDGFVDRRRGPVTGEALRPA